MPNVDPPLAFERGVERLARFRVFNKKPDFFLKLFVPCRTLCPELLCRWQPDRDESRPGSSCFNFLKKIINRVVRFAFPFFDIGMRFFDLLDKFRFNR